MDLTSGNSQIPENPFETGAAENLYLARDYGPIDVVGTYRWTLSRNFNQNTANSFDEVPVIKLTEYETDETTIRNQFEFYTSGVINSLRGNTDPMAPYKDLFPRKPTNTEYIFPYFSDVNFEVNTPVWASLDTLEQGGKAAESLAGVLGGQGFANFVGGAIQAGAAIAGAGLALSYPKVGIMDRPRLWQSHDFRTINIKFPLFNTAAPNDWKRNRSLCWTLINSNLFAKRDFITGIPPVHYEVLIPGQHYSYAACVTNLTINNRGNMRKLKDSKGLDAIVPDAYEINITLTDMVMPSRNLFQQIGKRAVQGS